MAERRAKRPKIERCEDDYLPGNITEIELHNFMTFDNLTCKPGSRLNLVIGPNGSGKSSLVCAIALCLGGEPQLLGRASSIGAFVKRGEESGYIKISLRGQTVNEHIIIMRKIDTRNKSEWLLNGKVIPKKEITDVIQRFNIQVNNLTQFLPQDRVCEFAKLNPIQLLEETEKAVGHPELPVKHRALVEKSCELKKHENAVERNGETLKQLMALNAEQEKDVERVRQKEELLTKVDSMKKKLPWLKYDMKKAVFMEAKAKSEEARKQLDEAAIALNELKNPIEMKKSEKALIETKCKKISGFINDNANERTRILREESHAVVKINCIKKEMEDLQKEEASRHQRILKVREELHAAQLQLENLPHYEPPREEFERLRGEIPDLRVLISSKKSQKLEKEKLLGQKKQTLRQCVDRLKDMENATTKVLHVLRNSGAEKIQDAYNWLQQHRNQLSKEVYGPLLLEVNTSDQQHASYLEGHLPHYVWKSFITQDSGDRDFMVKNMNSFGVPILNYVKDESYVRPPFQISKEMHELGIYSRLDQIFDAPTVVKEVLTSQFGLDSSYIGRKETDQNAVDVSKLGIFDFWTPESHYRWSVSRYGGHTSASVDAVGPARLLLSGADIGEMDKLRSRKNELEESIADDEESLKHLQTEQRVLENQYANLEKQREEIHQAVQKEKNRRRELQDRAEKKRKWLESQEKEDNLDIVMAKQIEEVASLNVKRFGYSITLKDLIGEAVGLKLEFTGKHMTSIEHSAKICEMEGSLKQQEKFAEQVAMRVEYCEKEVEECKQQLADAKRHAESIAVITPELEKAFLEMPGTIEELDAAMHDCIAEANSIYFLNQNILQEYECRQNEIKALSAKLDADKENVQRCLAEINTLKETWLPTLRNLVSQINETFSRNFQEMAVAGEVSLDEHETDFNQFGILIKVKFRQSGQLQVLSAHHQSGGERSVSTILYLVSLQDLTNCPFRVVDEINQGMDPFNERKMFQQLVRAASQPNTPQCFLLTPKLLPDLEYSEACSILNIMNGPWIEQASEVWSSGKSWRSVAGLVEESRC